MSAAKPREFEELLGKTTTFYGVYSNTFCVGVGGKRVAFEVEEDEDDGYRSMCKDIREVTLDFRIFFRRPIARVKIEEDPVIDGYRLVDVRDGHEWLRVGTDHADDYYPCFVFEYRPKEAR